MTEHPREFVVQRSKWLRGLPLNGTLLNANGGRCCLGFVASQCGVSDEALLNHTVPYALPREARSALAGLLLVDVKDRRKHTKLTMAAVVLNDSCSFTDDEREAQLSDLFAAHGYTLRFEP
jgi:hypothetical protein